MSDSKGKRRSPRLVVNGVTLPQQMISSCAGALLVSAFMTPLDVVKIRLQTQDAVYSKKCFLYSNGIMDHLYTRVNGDPPVAEHTREELCNCKWYNRPKYFNGTVDALVKIGRTEGVSSLWSGLSPTLVLAVPTTVIYLSTYEAMRKSFAKQYPGDASQEPLIPLAAGALSRTWAVTVVSPLELVRTKMQSEKMPYSKVVAALGNLVKQEGILGLWKGYSATLWRDVPFSAMYWPLYESFRGMLDMHDQPFASAFVSGACAGSVASTLTLPMDVIKTRRQIDFGEKTLLGDGTKKSPSTLATAREIMNVQGSRGLFVGLIPRILKVAPACAVMISSYEYCKRFFRERNEMQRLEESAQQQ